ncbi:MULTISPECIES: signal peptidase II [Paraclostridium]|uniref:Lipoprotein signal peptidase n=2 Tax=Paraclostridium bifermentans TaxID=1490 RepID=T4VT20_PARBF|nr:MULTISPECIES: signal peptidase II [Paraclostridium]MCU9806992.1 signal peptidase II [Paraclostridium sp. AKS46]MDV8108593.1 signal peptidase II [Bacillus sp. BAU-SS-2023]EQK43847.1 signal peptidase II [[Clostridium] bifermentans ATCC 638] [Paraclostridium bifermentans ATCC 638 = DSM 14991]MBN8048429.1 signal peptidase II [Paraclostridium bifermentans]MBS5952813.1 signal peptidase II [Paraclostridium bifermentans]
MIYILIILGLIGLDQISKFLAVKYLVNIGSIPIIKDIFHLTYVENRGAAFGMFQNNQMIFVVVALAACIFGLYYLYKKQLNLLGKSAIILIIAGAIGNLIDRVRLGFVVDYFDFRIVWNYVFNVADVFVVIGTILLCIYIIFFENDK